MRNNFLTDKETTRGTRYVFLKEDAENRTNVASKQHNKTRMLGESNSEDTSKTKATAGPRRGGDQLPDAIEGIDGRDVKSSNVTKSFKVYEVANSH